MSIFTKENSEYIYELFQEFMNSINIYIIWIMLHWCCSALYVEYCAPQTFIGFFMSPIYAVTPVCKALRWTIYNSGSSIEAMWFIIGSIFLKKLIPIKFGNN